MLDATGPVARVTATAEAVALIDRLVSLHGPVLFHQSGGCCDGSSPMCYPRGEFVIGDSDVLLGQLPDPSASPFYMWVPQFEYWSHTHLTLDVVPGRGSGFSLEAPEGVRFLIRSRLFTDAESDGLTDPVVRPDVASGPGGPPGPSPSAGGEG